MNSTNQIQPVQLSAIDMQDRTYNLTDWEDIPSDNLLTSIKRFGILHPPILQRKTNNIFCIVAGRKRLAAAHHLAPDTPVFCRTLPADFDELTTFSLLLEDAATGTPLTPAEQITFFEKLLVIASMEEVFPMLVQLGYKPQKHILQGLLELRSLNESVLRAMHEGKINIKNSRKLLKLSATDQDVVVQVISDLHLGGSKQLKLIELCTELILRKNMSLEDILGGFYSKLEQEDPLNIPQQGSVLLSGLYNECFPLATKAENNFKQQVARLDLPSTMHISHTQAFEDEKTTLSITFPDWDSFGQAIKKIKKLQHKE